MSANQGISGASAATLDKDPADQSAVSHCAETALENTDAQTALTSESLPQRLSITARLNAIKLSEKVKLRAKIAVSVVLFASLFLFGKVDLSKSIDVALKANPWYLLLAMTLFLGSTFLNAHRWKLLASAVGGDFSRCYYLSKGTGKYSHAFYSVLADRTIGIAVLFLFASVGILCGPGGSLPLQLKLPILAGTVVLFSLLPFLPTLALRLLGPDNWISKQLNNSPAAVYWHSKKLMAITIGLSVVMQVVIVMCHVAIGLALGLNNIPLWYYFVFYPSVAVLGFITPSFNGIGIREWAYTYFLTLAGVDRAPALTYAIIWLGFTTVSSLVGGLVYLLGHFKMPKAEVEKV